MNWFKRWILPGIDMLCALRQDVNHLVRPTVPLAETADSDFAGGLSTNLLILTFMGIGTPIFLPGYASKVVSTDDSVYAVQCSVVPCICARDVDRHEHGHKPP